LQIYNLFISGNLANSTVIQFEKQQIERDIEGGFCWVKATSACYSEYLGAVRKPIELL